MTRIRLVIASPNDVVPERDAIEQVAIELNRLLGRSGNFSIDVYRWETDSGPGFNVLGPQGKVDRDLPIAGCDIMVAVFWMRFGTPIRSSSKTGTEHEIDLAFEAWKTTGVRPQVLVYFKKAPPDWDAIDPAQIRRVKAFRAKFNPGGRYEQGLYSEFVSIEEFKSQLREHIAQYLPQKRRGRRLASQGFDHGEYRLKFGFEPKWDLSNIGVAQAPGDAPVSPTLDQIYQELRVSDKPGQHHGNEGAPLVADGVVKLKTPLILIGPAGAGKTTWVRHTFYQLLQRDDVWPFYIELRKAARSLKVGKKSTAPALSFVNYLRATLEEMDCKTRGLREALQDKRGPRPILLVDGWDELGTLGREFREKLASFIRAHPRVGVVATSRPYGLEKPDASDGFAQRYVQPLNDQEINEFSLRFWEVCYGKDPKHKDSAQKFLDALAAAPAAKDLARTPLLCTMMLFISRSRTLPDERHDLYAECIKHMLSAYRREEADVPGMDHHWRPDQMNERLRSVAALAFAVHQLAEPGMGRAIVLPAKRMAQLLPSNCKSQGAAFLGWLSGPAGLLTDNADGSMSFAHLSFQEYLAAWHIANVLPEHEQAFDVWIGDRRWREVLRLWAAILWSGPRERFEAVGENFLTTGEGLDTLGAILADGWGSLALFRKWLKKFPVFVASCAPSEVQSCGQAWRNCRQIERRTELQRLWSAEVRKWNWFTRLSARRWARAAGFHMSHVSGQVGIIEEALGRGALSEQHCALGRAWTFLESAWPSEQPELALLQVWPSARRVIGLRAQTFVSLQDVDGWTEQLVQFKNHDLSISRDIESRFNHLKADLWKVVHNLFRDKVSMEDLDEILHAWATYRVRYSRDDLRLKPIRLMEVSGGGEGIVLMFDKTALFMNTGRSKSLDGRVQLGGRRVSQLLESKYSSGGSAKEATNDFEITERAAFHRLAARAEFASCGRMANPAINLISIACRESLRPGSQTVKLARALNSFSGDPLWPALARHLANQSTETDRGFLVDLARHPEKREPPLRWGLQYIVRGDVMMPDYSVRPLDEFFACHGMEPPSYLEDVQAGPLHGVPERRYRREVRRVSRPKQKK